MEELAYRFGRTYDSYNTVHQDSHCFYVPGLSGVMFFFPSWFEYHVVGGIIASERDKPAVVDRFCDFCAARGKKPVIYNVCDDDVPLLLSRGFEVTKWGEEPIVPIGSADWRGRQYEWVRRQENYGVRHGLELREVAVDREDGWPALRREIEELSRDHVRRTPHGREMAVLEGSLSLDRFHRRRLFLAESDGSVQGFVVCNPCDGGRRWAFELYRRAETAPRGTVAFLFMKVMRALKAEGVEEVSLSLTPGVNCGGQRGKHSRVLVFWMHVLWNYTSWLMDLRGIYHFKSRFRPRFEDRYVAALPNFGFVQSATMGWKMKLVRPNPVSVVRHLARRLGKIGVRRGLAAPLPARDDKPAV